MRKKVVERGRETYAVHVHRPEISLPCMQDSSEESSRSDLCQLLKEIRRQDGLDLVRQVLDRHAEPVEKEMRDVGRDLGILMREKSEQRCA